MSKYRGGIAPEYLGHTLADYIGKELIWLRDAPWGYGELFVDDVTLIRLTEHGRAVVELTDKNGKRVKRTIHPGRLNVPVIDERPKAGA